ncbi:MAG: TRAP transporter large permease subunit [Dehalococcoidales bacterium]
MSIEITTLLIFGSLIVVLLAGVPLTFALAGIAAIFAFFLWGPNSLSMFAGGMFRYMTSFVLVALPLFFFMANVLERSGIADDLYELMYKWMGPTRGGLAIGTVNISTIMAAMSGISGASCVTMGLIALPSMLKRNYGKHIALGSIMAGGALGVLIPPSVPMILYGFFAQESVGRLFAGGIMPGLLLSGMFIVYIYIRCRFKPSLGPPVPKEDRANWREKFALLRSLILPIILIMIVLGSIFSGLATPSEAAALGALGSLLCASIKRQFTWKTLRQASYQSLRLTCLVLWIVAGASLFVSVYTAVGAPEFIKNVIVSLPVNRWVIMIGIQALLFMLGCFMDPGGIIMLTTPVLVPVIATLGFDPIWFGVVFIVNMEMAFLTPPFGMNLFYMRGIVPPEVSMVDIINSVWPFVALQAVGLIICMAFPQIILWIPNLLLGAS